MTENQDKLTGQNMPRAGYAITGADFAGTKGKDAPMIINLHTPGVFADDWSNTYGTSLDSFLSIIDGFKVVEGVNTMSIDGVYKDSFPNMKTENVFSKVTHSDYPETPIQQIQYVVSGDDIEVGRTRVDNFGNVFNVRGLCLRGPMMLCGYGRTKDMLPLTKDDDNERLNSEDSKLDRSLWKGGTIDVRWDERRNVWGAWQDMIVDHEKKGLGTTVFSTNPDLDKGFPYLKGKLEDVWWVRQPDSLKNTDGKIEGTQTAEIMTHLKHKFYDEGTDGSAKLDTVFIIPHNDASEADDSCHKKGVDREVGDELTGDGLAIDIRTTVHFWKDDEMDGAIQFGEKKSDLGDKVACKNDDACYFTGTMVFLDEAITSCASRDQAASSSSVSQDISGGGNSPCEWVPAIQIDECELVGGHFGTLYGNDETVANRVNALCAEINGWSENLAEAVKGNDSTAIGLAGEACDKVVELAKGTTEGFGSITAQTQAAFKDAAAQISNSFQIFGDLINAALKICGCESNIVFGPDYTFGSNLATPKVEATPCAATIGKIPEFDCGQCVPVELKAPCSKEAKSGEASFNVGPGCDGNSFPRPTYDENVGLCQANDTL